MNINCILKDGSFELLNMCPIENLIDEKKLEKIDGRRKLPRILDNSNLTSQDKQTINKRKKRINQQNALKAFRLRERVSIGRLENEITRKMIEKRKLELEVMELNREIKELAMLIQ